MNIAKKCVPILIALLAGIAVVTTGCEKERNPLEGMTPSEATPTGKREFGEINPVVLALPQKAVEALAGTDVRNNPVTEAYIYFRGMTLVAYRDTFDIKEYIDSIAATFAELSRAPEFAQQADTWAIQMQERSGPQFVAMSCSPKNAANFAKNSDLEKLLTDCDYLMIDDKIISDPRDRISNYNEAARQHEGPEIPVETP